MERPGTGERYSPEVRARAVQMVLEHADKYGPQCAAIVSISEEIGFTAGTLRWWVRQAERDEGPEARADERRSASWSGRTASCARRVRSFARRLLILPYPTAAA